MISFRLDHGADTNGSHQLAEFEVSPGKLVARFGKPRECDGYKVSGKYTFVDESGRAFTVYDWKATSLFDDSPGDDGLPLLWTPDEFWAMEEPYTFQVGGKEESGLDSFLSWLAGEVT